MADQPKPLTEDEMILQSLSAEVRKYAQVITHHALELLTGNLNAGARETAQMINAAAGRLSALVRQRENTLARVQRDRGTPIRFAHAGECTAPDFYAASMVCRTCGHPAERHGGVDHLGDAQAVPMVRCQRWARGTGPVFGGQTTRCNTEHTRGTRCPNAGNHTGAPTLFDSAGS